MKTLDGRTYEAMIVNGFKDLKTHYETVNELNVFPVPDGDTGTNICATLEGGVKAMKRANKAVLGDVVAKCSEGMLLGARGNSGVITSQFFAGIAYPFFNVAGAERDSIFPNITNDLLNFMVPALIGKKD